MMELFCQLLIKAMGEEKLEASLSELKMDAKDLVEMQSYRALRRIKEIIEDPELEDPDCFQRIEEMCHNTL